MRVEVDEAGREDEPGAVDLARTAFGDATDRGDAITGDGEVAAHGLGSGPVAERRAADDEVGHRADF